MNIQANCPGCKKIHLIPVEWFGGGARCGCGTVITLRPADQYEPEEDELAESLTHVVAYHEIRAALAEAEQRVNEEGTFLDKCWTICGTTSVIVGLSGLALGLSGVISKAGAIQFSFFLGVGVFATICAFAPTEILIDPRVAATIDARTPIVARCVCAIVSVACVAFSISVVPTFLG